MLSRIDLRNFKCFQELKLPLRPLTLLSGPNAAGKSSVIQAVVLLHQTMRDHERSSRLMLNGSVIRLGTAADVLDQNHARRAFEIELFDGDASWCHWEFEGERKEMSMLVRRTRGENDTGANWDADGSADLQCLVPSPMSGITLCRRLMRLSYLTAERLGPRDEYLLADPQLTPVVGPRGEFTVSVLYSGRDMPVIEPLLLADIPNNRFRQVEARMGTFFPGCVLEVKEVERANAVTLGIRMSRSTEFLRPIHSGFGPTQILPIFVSALSADRDDLLLIENPEVHLHPAAQAKIGEFLCEVANSGIQVVVETHSDHVLNGIRRAVKDNVIASDRVALHFFQPRNDDAIEATPQVQTPLLDSRGNIDSWPKGFFDQFDVDMNYFADWH